MEELFISPWTIYALNLYCNVHETLKVIVIILSILFGGCFLVFITNPFEIDLNTSNKKRDKKSNISFLIYCLLIWDNA